jgi:formylglycine-generating enzyme required for sulfatase activity
MRTTRLLCVLSIIVAVAACTSTTVKTIDRECRGCPRMMTIPAGTAILGAVATDSFRNADELPERTFVIARSFAVSRSEITRGEFEAFVRATHREVKGNCLTDRRQPGNWQLDDATTFRDPGFAQADDHPVACVSWDDAKAYIAWLNTQTSGGYRMLTEVEWEYVARAGARQNSVYPWGANAADGCAFANGFDQTAQTHYATIDRSGYKTFDPMACSDARLNTAPVGSYAPNAFGVYDMIGNVSEWVEDCSTATHNALNVSGASPASEEGACPRRIAKGGSWGTLAHNLRTADRFPYVPGHRDDSIGIRVARTLK